MNQSPARVEIIENSLKCFQLGLLGLLPVFGITCAVRSLLHYRHLTSSQSGAWNPAHPYVRWGGICARLGLVVSLFGNFGLAGLLPPSLGEQWGVICAFPVPGLVVSLLAFLVFPAFCLHLSANV